MGLTEILNRRNVDPASYNDDIRVIRSFVDYMPDNKTVRYMIYELEIMDKTGELRHFYKAVKLARIIRLPKSAKQSLSFMDMHTQVLSGVWEEEINFITIIANMIEPVPLGLMFMYGIQGVAEELEMAMRIADNDYAALAGLLQGSYRTLEFRPLNSEEVEWLREKMYGMNHLSVVRGLPKPRQGGADVGNKGMGGSNLNPDSQDTTEEFIAGMADREYVVQILSTPVGEGALRDWLTKTSKEMTRWQGQLTGQKAMNFGISLPMMYMANLGASEGWAHSYSDAENVGVAETHTEGTSFTESMSTTQSTSSSRSLSLSESLSQNQSQSTSEGSSTSDSVSASASQSESAGTSTSDSISTSDSVSASASKGVNQGVSESSSVGQGKSVGESSSVSHSEGESSSISHGHTEGSNYSYNEGESSSSSHSKGVNQSFGKTQSQSSSTGTSSSRTSGSSSSVSSGRTQNTSTGTSRSSSSGGGTNWGSSTGTNSSRGSSYGGNVGIKGTGFSGSLNSSQGSSSGSNWGQSTNHSNTSGTSRSVSNGVSSSQTFGNSTSNTVGSSQSVTSGSSVSQTQGTSEGWSNTQGTSRGQSWGSNVSDSMTTSKGVNSSTGWSKGINSSESINSSQSAGSNYGISASQGIGASRGIGTSTGVGTSQGVGSSVGVGASRGAGTNQGTGASQGIGASQGVSYSESQSNSFGVTKGYSKGSSVSDSVSNNWGRSQGITQGASGSISQATSASMGVGPSLSYSKSFQWLDQEVQNIITLLEFQNDRLMRALNGNGAFFTDVYIATPDEETKASAQALAKSAWYNEEAFICPLQVMDLSPEEQSHLLYHFNAFSADTSLEGVAGDIESYKYTTILLPDEYAAYTHLPRISEGGVFADVSDIPKFAVPSMRKGEIYMGKILSGERWTEKWGYMTPFDYRIQSDEIMHGFFTGESRSGKTVAATRFIAELANKVRRDSGKRMRIICMDPKQDWRILAKFVEPERFHFYSLGNPEFLPINLNVCKIPKNVYPQQWVDGLIEIYCRAYGLGERGKSVLSETFFALYEEEGVFVPNWREVAPERSGQVTLPRVYERMLQTKIDLEDPKRSGRGRVGNDVRDAYSRVLDRLQVFGRPFSIESQLFGREDGMGIDELIGGDDVVVLESYGLETTFKNFIFGMITSAFFKYAQAHEGGFKAPDQYETILVIEEANEVLTGQDSADGQNMGPLSGQSEFEKILDQSAGLGLFIFSITQKIASMPSSVIANSGLVFAGKISRAEDVSTVIRKIGREERYDDRDLVKWFPRSPIGWFVCRSSRNFDFKETEPVLVKIEPLSVDPPTNEELLHIMAVKNALKHKDE